MSELPYVFLVGVTKHNIALLFCHYLDSLGIKTVIEKEAQGYAIFCLASEQEQAQALWDEFKENPADKKYQNLAWQSGEVKKVSNDEPALTEQLYQQFFQHAGFVTLCVFVLCWIVFLAGEIGWKKQSFELLHFYFSFNLDAIIHQPHRLIGAVFFHFSWLHIVFNTMWWWQLGGSVEKTLNKSTLFSLLLASGILSNIAQFYSTGPLFGGLSGVVYALVGYVWWLGWLAPQLGLSLSKPIVGFLLFWLLLGFVDVLPINMGNAAHTVGLICGCVMAWLKAKKLNQAFKN